MRKPVTIADLESFRVSLQTWVQQSYQAAGNLPQFAPTIELQSGQKYVRLVYVSGPQRSAYGFVDMTTGDLLKSDGWKKPAKHARGNLFAANPLAGCGPYGMAYLKN